MAGIALGLALILASPPSAHAKARAAHARPPVAVVGAPWHQSAARVQPKAHAAGHKIA